MSYPFENLKPTALWRNFYKITQIPRPSKKEEKIRQFLLDWGKSHGLDTLVDPTGNVLIRKPATPGMENRQTIVLQSHMDMVCEKNSDVTFDFDNDPIQPRIDGEWVKATGTTLGADNGIGVATQMTILEATDIAHGPLECLFTTDEETGLTGAFGLDPKLLKGKLLINIDSEDEGEIYIGCAGGKGTIIKLPVVWEALPESYAAFVVDISGLQGGHSGDEIHKGLGNSNKILNRILWNISQYIDIRISSFSGGNLHNAIPREAKAIVAVPNAKLNDFRDRLDKLSKEIWNELQHTDPGLKVACTQTLLPDRVMSHESQRNLLLTLYSCPHGVIAMSPVIPGLVETSTNLASVRTQDDHILIATSQRSSIESAKNDAAIMVANAFRLAGAEVEHGEGYPGWTPNPASPLLEISKNTFKKVYGYDAAVKAIHAGLECGLIGEKYPAMDMVSIGPTIKGPHSPDERMKISTVEPFWKWVVELLKAIPPEAVA